MHPRQALQMRSAAYAWPHATSTQHCMQVDSMCVQYKSMHRAAHRSTARPALAFGTCGPCVLPRFAGRPPGSAADAASWSTCLTRLRAAAAWESACARAPSARPSQLPAGCGDGAPAEGPRSPLSPQRPSACRVGSGSSEAHVHRIFREGTQSVSCTCPQAAAAASGPSRPRRLTLSPIQASCCSRLPGYKW